MAANRSDAPGLRKRPAVIIGMTAIGFVALAIIIRATLIPSNPYTNRDFMSLYAGGRAILTGLDPYDPDVWPALRARLGSTWFPDDRSPFPLWTLLLVTPFSLLDPDWAAASWLALSLLSVEAGLILLLHTLKRRKTIPFLEVLVLTLVAFTSRGTVLSIYDGQITFQIFLLLALFLYLERVQRDFLAGIALGAVLLKPNPFVLFVPALGLWLLYKRRWSVMAGGAAAGGALFVLAWIFQPGWIAEWVNVRDKSLIAPLTPTLWGLSSDLAGTYWPVVGLVLVAAATALFGWLIFSRRDLTVAQVTSLALIGSLLVTPYAWACEHVLLLVPVVMLFLAVRDRWQATALLVLIGFGVPWAAYWLAHQRYVDTFSAVTIMFIGLAFWFCVLRTTPRMMAGQTQLDAQTGGTNREQAC